jgi:hypothetical protein|tara:strand:- start:342 stop:989 length:648 start_codon:yes stop_codon:yes gene_type:complete
MTVYVGDTNAQKMVRRLKDMGWGRMLIFRTVDLYDGEPWSLDNGAYKAWRNGVPFDGPAFLDRLEFFRAWAPWPPDFLVLPDIHRGGVASLVESVSWGPRLQGDWPLALALQDGMDAEDVSQVLGDLDGVSTLFLGGSNAFKSKTKWWVDWGHERGLTVHYGRCGTLPHARNALYSQPDSLDSAFPLWHYDRFDQFSRILEDGDWQMELITRDKA